MRGHHCSELCAGSFRSRRLQFNPAAVNVPDAKKKLPGTDCESSEFSLTPPAVLDLSEIKNDNKKLTLRSGKSDRQHIPALKPRYINVQRPAMGRASATITLNKNGTLASAAGEVESDLVAKVFEEFPIGESVSSILGLEGDIERCRGNPLGR